MLRPEPGCELIPVRLAADHGIDLRPPVLFQRDTHHGYLCCPDRLVVEVNRNITAHPGHRHCLKVRAARPEPCHPVSQGQRLRPGRHHQHRDPGAQVCGPLDQVLVPAVRRVELPDNQAMAERGRHSALLSDTAIGETPAGAIPADRRTCRQVRTPAMHSARNSTYTIAVRSSRFTTYSGMYTTSAAIQNAQFSIFLQFSRNWAASDTAVVSASQNGAMS